MGTRTNTTVAQDKLTQHGPAHGEMLQVVSFHVGEEEFGLDILRVQEIIRVQRLTRVPNSHKFGDGVINLRGRVIPVIDLRKRVGIDGTDEGNETHNVEVDVKGADQGVVVGTGPAVSRI